MQKKFQKQICIIFMVILCLCEIVLGVYFGNRKLNLHADEVVTYALANAADGIMMEMPEGEYLTPAVFDDVMTVNEGEQFHYASVWENQDNDVHPPLYYALLHTICSFFSGAFSIWIGIAINAFFSILVTFFIFRISHYFTKDAIGAGLVAAMWVFSNANVNFILFIRMYMMLLAMCLLFVWTHLKYYDKQKTVKFYSMLFLSTLAGTLTHYYFLIFIFFVCAVYFFNLLYQKKWKELLYYIAIIMSAGISAVLIFHGVVKHILFGERGTESRHNLFNIESIVSRVEWFARKINLQTFAGYIPWILCICVLVSIFILIKNGNVWSNLQKKLHWSNIITSPWTILCFPMACYFLLVSQIAVYQVERYMITIYPIVVLSIGTLCYSLCSGFTKRKYIAYLSCVLLILLSIHGLRTVKMEFRYDNAKENMNFAKENSTQNVIVIGDNEQELLYYAYMELINYEQFVYIQADRLSVLQKKQLDDMEEVIVYVLADEKERIVEELDNIFSNCDMHYQPFPSDIWIYS